MEQTPRPKSPPVRSLDRQLVLDEDEYTAALSHIIKRDFFPSLAQLDATNDYLDALRSEDPQLIDATVTRLENLATPAPATSRTSGYYQPQNQTPSQTPWAAGPSDTPLHPSSSSFPESERPQKRVKYDTDMSLDEFQAKYTSEDNSSFIQILEDENRRRREKYGWAWEAQKRVEAQRDRMLEAREKMMIEPGPGSAPGVKEKLVIEAPKPVGLITAAPTSEEDKSEEGTKEEKQDGKESEGKEVAVVSKRSNGEEEKEQLDVMAPKKDARPAGVDGWKFKARNALMFTPDADVSPHAVVKAPPAPSRGEPKAISHTSTRLPEQNESSSGMSEPPSPTRSRIDAAIAGTPYRPRSPATNGFSLVPSLPSPTPSELGPAAVKQLMTWGTLNATPRILSSEDPVDVKNNTPPPLTFHIAEPTAREAIGHKLSNKAVKSLRAKAALMSGGSGSSTGLGFRTPTSTRGDSSSAGSMMPPPNWTPRKADAQGSLTPAAKRLLDRSTMGAAATRRAEAMGKTAGWEGNGTKAKEKEKEKDMSKVRWTPSPALTRKR